jgi:hypothetical protein
MANENDPRLEEISTKSLPLSEREENPPLVVDLPDGQKLVVGDIKAGTVIEVATWRGTGRPDSRTHRFMLGISHDEPEALVRPTKAEPEVVVNKVVEPASAIVVEAPAVIEVAPEVALEVPEISVEVPEVFVDVPAVETETEANVEAKLEEEIETISEVEEPIEEETLQSSNFIAGERLSSRTDLLFGASTQYIDKSVAYFPPANPTKQLVAPVSNMKMKKSLKKFLPLVYSAAGIVALIVTLFAFNISIAHPQSGLDTALGDAKSSLMIVQSKDVYVVGESIVGDTQSESNNPVFGVIAAVGDGVYMLNGDLGYLSVAQDEVRGKVLAIAPWWGKLASFVGL